MGLGVFAGVDYDLANVVLDRTMSPDGKRRLSGKTSQDEGAYPGWDRFGRVNYHAWVDIGMDTTGSPGHPNRAMVYGEGCR